MVDMKKAIKEPFFRDCIPNVLRKGSLDMKIYAIFFENKLDLSLISILLNICIGKLKKMASETE